ncbi:hypothetical protein ACIQWN_36840 [Streptomyces vinaceus]|uniref:hypothetical protein n=1 Tax=Streptomyces vinaceus TaxID=1960 RepID=UPI003828A430
MLGADAPADGGAAVDGAGDGLAAAAGLCEFFGHPADHDAAGVPDQVDAFGPGGDLLEPRVRQDGPYAGQQLLALIIHAVTLKRLEDEVRERRLGASQVWMRLLGPSWPSAMSSLNQ